MALNAFPRTALQSDLVGQFMLGTMYDFGEGVAEDNVQAVVWYRKAAKQKDEYAMLLVESYSKFEILGDVLAYNSNVSEISLVDPEWLQDILVSNPGITTIQLTSNGGDLLAAYPMAVVIIDFGWDDEFDFAEWAYSDAVNDVVVELRFMLERGVDPGFAIRTLDAIPDGMWFSSRTEMEAAGVLRE